MSLCNCNPKPTYLPTGNLFATVNSETNRCQNLLLPPPVVPGENKFINSEMYDDIAILLSDRPIFSIIRT